jgi:hypothetical protein
MQHASKASHGFSPGQPVYMTPQYLPYLSIGGTENREDKNVLSFFRKGYLCKPSKVQSVTIFLCIGAISFSKREENNSVLFSSMSNTKVFFNFDIYVLQKCNSMRKHPRYSASVHNSKQEDTSY